MNSKQFRIIIFTVFVLITGIGLYFSSLPGRKSDFEVAAAEGEDAYKDKFTVVEDGVHVDKPQVLGEQDDSVLLYKSFYMETPLTASDYYYGKHTNAAAGAIEINSIPVLKPGDRIRVIRDGYMTMTKAKGYVNTFFVFASGVCWSTSALGATMDEANKFFNERYGLPLFVFQPGDRGPHKHTYTTYNNSNGGWGYSVSMYTWGVADYSFTVNPQLAQTKKFKDLRIKIVMVPRNDSNRAYLGQTIDGYISSNIEL